MDNIQNQLALASAADWFIKGHTAYYHVCVIRHVQDLLLSVVRVGYSF